MSFYKCTVCGIGTDLARQCGRGRCSHLESRCEAHGGDYEAIKAIQEHMKSHDATPEQPSIVDHEYLSAGDTPYASGDRALTGCFLCGRARKDHSR